MSTSVNIPLDNMQMTLAGGLSISTTPIEVTSTVIGDPNKPVGARITGDTAHPIATLVTGDPAKPVSALLTGDENKPITSTLQGNPAKPISSAVDLLNLPKFTLADIKDLQTPKIRVRLPNYQQYCFKLFGTEIWSLCIGGEGQAITEPYVPNSHERCEDECCEPDTRPFPEQQKRDVIRDNLDVANNG